MALRANVLFTYDAQGRMVAPNEPYVPSRRPAPSVWLGWTLQRYHLRIGADVSTTRARELASIIEAAPPPGYGLDWELQGDIVTTLGGGVGEGGPAYRFGDA